MVTKGSLLENPDLSFNELVQFWNVGQLGS